MADKPGRDLPRHRPASSIKPPHHGARPTLTPGQRSSLRSITPPHTPVAPGFWARDPGVLLAVLAAESCVAAVIILMFFWSR
ncbi:hypothetical protein ACT6QH_02100 [Xanthobacter sp. TB0139]|uniref:hypothetical protein n=1 Tax=Xanthobacter sp. TB0139 TaxID=3459178 RepID=UPI004039EA44